MNKSISAPFLRVSGKTPAAVFAATFFLLISLISGLSLFSSPGGGAFADTPERDRDAILQDRRDMAGDLRNRREADTKKPAKPDKGNRDTIKQRRDIAASRRTEKLDTRNKMQAIRASCAPALADGPREAALCFRNAVLNDAKSRADARRTKALAERSAKRDARNGNPETGVR